MTSDLYTTILGGLIAGEDLQMATDTKATTFTAGPWRWKHDAIKFDKIQGADGSTVADLPGWGLVSDANARLIAAAPELYEAVHEVSVKVAELIEAAPMGLASWDAERHRTARHNLNMAVARAQIALAKADGR